MFFKHYWQFLVVVVSSLVLLLIESIIKYFFILNKIPQEGFYLFGKFFQIVFVPNSNIAFSLSLNPIFIILLIIAILIILSYYWWLNLLKLQLLKFLGLSLIIIGAVSNLLDRLFLGYVVDYINFNFWPVFNLADTLIVIGCIIYLLAEIFWEKHAYQT